MQMINVTSPNVFIKYDCLHICHNYDEDLHEQWLVGMSLYNTN